MDTIEKTHRIILAISFAICLFIYADVYLSPLKNSVEIVQAEKYFSQSRRHNSKTYELITDKRKIDVTYTLYQDVGENDTIIVQSSVITGSVQKVLVDKGGGGYIYKIGFARVLNGWLYLPLVTLGIIVFFTFYTSLKNMQGRRNMTFVLLICSLLLLFFHIGFSIF